MVEFNPKDQRLLRQHFSRQFIEENREFLYRKETISPEELQAALSEFKKNNPQADIEAVQVVGAALSSGLARTAHKLIDPSIDLYRKQYQTASDEERSIAEMTIESLKLIKTKLLR
jgi:hypothetical protein